MVENDTNRFDVTLQVEAPVVGDGTCAKLSVKELGEGSLRFVRLEGNTVICTGTMARSECPLGADDQLRLLPDGTLLYSSRSEFGETVGPIRKQ
jgi:hypothetical protein